MNTISNDTISNDTSRLSTTSPPTVTAQSRDQLQKDIESLGGEDGIVFRRGDIVLIEQVSKFEDHIGRLKAVLDFLNIRLGKESRPLLVKNDYDQSIRYSRTEIQNVLSTTTARCLPSVLLNVISAYAIPCSGFDLCSGGCMHEQLDIRTKHWNLNTPLFERAGCPHLYHELCLRARWLRYINEYHAHTSAREYNLAEAPDISTMVCFPLHANPIVPANFCDACQNTMAILQPLVTDHADEPIQRIQFEKSKYYTWSLTHYKGMKHMPLSYAVHLPTNIFQVGDWIDIQHKPSFNIEPAFNGLFYILDQQSASDTSSSISASVKTTTMTSSQHHTVWIGQARRSLMAARATLIIIPNRFWQKRGKPYYDSFNWGVYYNLTATDPDHVGTPDHEAMSNIAAEIAFMRPYLSSQRIIKPLSSITPVNTTTNTSTKRDRNDLDDVVVTDNKRPRHI